MKMQNSPNIVVQKFGGTSVATPQKLKSVASFIKQKLLSVEKICVVVSAMGHTTNELIKLAHEVNINPSKRELDMLISCGERSSMALLAMALHNIGISAKSLTGSQSGIITNENHSGAEIIAIRPERVFQAFLEHQVVIIAGFQGISNKLEITTLRRGGSDTTAVAMAAALNAQCCEIYTDVLGVMDCDPNIVSAAKPIEFLSSEQMCAMSLYGAKVMAYDALRLARSFGVEIVVAKSTDKNTGTKIGDFLAKNTQQGVSAISHLRAVVRISLPLSDCAKYASNYFLCGHISDENFIAYVSNDIAQELSFDHSQTKSALALITLHFFEQSEIPQSLSRAAIILRENNINLIDAMLAFGQVFLVIDDHSVVSALNFLHQGLRLEGSNK